MEAQKQRDRITASDIGGRKIKKWTVRDVIE